MSPTVIDPPGVLRYLPDSLGSAEMVARVDAALKAGMEVWFPIMPEDRKPFFALKPVRGSIQVCDGDGRHVGTFASAEAAIARGWERGCGI